MKKIIFCCLSMLCFNNYSQSSLCLSFTSNSLLPVASGSKYLRADFNNDGQMDFLSTIYPSNGFNVTLSNGSGGFLTPVSYSPSLYISTKLGDFNNDGNADIVSSDTNGTVIKLIAGSATGVFGTVTTTSAGAKPYNLTVDDFNNDGKKDIAIINKGTTHFSLLLGNGLGSFSNPVTFNTSYLPEYIYSADFNNDGKKDILVSYSNSNLLTTYKGGGNGTFTLTNNYNLGYITNEMNIGDFNNDAKLDLVSFGGAGITTINGTGNCTFTSQTTYSTSGFNPSIYKPTIGDLNGDGRADIAMIDALLYPGIELLISNSSNGFLPIVTYTSVQIPYAICGPIFVTYYVDIFDYNNDGKNDLVYGDDGCNKLFGMVNCNDVGIAENKLNELIINSFPNPANEKLNIQFTTNDLAKEFTKAEVINSIGQSINEIELNYTDNTAHINTNELPAGVYHLLLKSNNQSINKRFVIAR